MSAGHDPTPADLGLQRRDVGHSEPVWLGATARLPIVNGDIPMKSTFLSSLAQRGWLRRTAVWPLGALILAIGLSACGGQADPVPTVASPAATPVPDTNPDVAPVEVSQPPAESDAAQATTGFNISGWV